MTSSAITYRTIWRWHFYAGVFSIPFILWLSITGSIYLFRPQIEAWLDRPYDHLVMGNAGATPAAQVEAALHAVPNIVALAIYLPEMAISLASVLLLERTVFSRIPTVSRWLGLGRA